MKRILILYVNAGHGHKKVAEAVRDELLSRKLDHVEVEISDALNFTNPLFRFFYPRIYFYLVVSAPWLWGFFFSLTDIWWFYRLISPLRSFWNYLQSGALRTYVKEKPFDTVLFTHFFPAEVLATEKKKGRLSSKLVTVITDVIPHATWQNPGTDIYWVMAEETRTVLTKRGAQNDQVLAKGIPISSDFLKHEDAGALRGIFGLKSDALTLLFSSGSFGIGPTEETLDLLSRLEPGIQVVVVCGNNKILFERLKLRRFPFPIALFGFTDKMHEIMSVSNLLIAKPGGSTTCESLVKKLPMIMMKPIPGQEAFNAEWLVQHKAAYQAKSAEEIVQCVRQIQANPSELKTVIASIDSIAKPNAARDLADFVLN